MFSSFKKRFQNKRFAAIIAINNANPFDLSLQDVVHIENAKSHPLDPSQRQVVADPFLFVHNDELYLFYEECKRPGDKGVIKCIKTRDLKKWTKPQLALEEPFHLSYPNVFEIDGNIYMMPESCEDQSIRLYKAVDNDLTKWEHVHTLLKGEAYADSAIIKIENVYYLFTTFGENGRNKLYLYVSDSLFGKWEKHPMSPSSGVVGQRCAGSIIKWNNALYRPAQREDRYYGDGVDVYKIDSLTPTEFKESLHMEKMIPQETQYYNIGGHHINMVNFLGNNIVTTDCLVEGVNLFTIIRRKIQNMK